ncbi:MAG: alpha/beta hydrolase, partial [Pikeienuella sp.]
KMRNPATARAAFESAARRIFRMPSGVNVIDGRIEGPAGPIPIEWVSRGRPERRAVVLYLHGGAYLMGSPATHRHVAAELAGCAGARALVPAYRLAPETRWPGAVEDALACYRDLLQTGYEPRAIAFAGDSAGGGLAFATLVAAREAGLPDPACIAAFSPWLDLTLNQPSLKRNARSDPMLPASRIDEVRDFYVSGADARAPTASPLLADLPAPPPVLIQASRIELLED